MTAKEMTEIFSVLMLAYPGAEMFKGGIEKLLPTINLWAMALPEVDFWTGQQAAVQLCRTCKYPPTIAEFKERAEKVLADLQSKFQYIWDGIKLADRRPGGITAYYKSLQPDDPVRAAIDALGGPDKLIQQHKDPAGNTVSCWNYYDFRRAYFSEVKSRPALPGGKRKALTGGTR